MNDNPAPILFGVLILGVILGVLLIMAMALVSMRDWAKETQAYNLQYISVGMDADDAALRLGVTGSIPPTSVTYKGGVVATTYSWWGGDFGFIAIDGKVTEVFQETPEAR